MSRHVAGSRSEPTSLMLCVRHFVAAEADRPDDARSASASAAAIATAVRRAATVLCTSDITAAIVAAGPAPPATDAAGSHTPLFDATARGRARAAASRRPRPAPRRGRGGGARRGPARPGRSEPRPPRRRRAPPPRSEEHTSELQSHSDLVCRLLLEKKKKITRIRHPTTNKINVSYIQ